MYSLNPGYSLYPNLFHQFIKNSSRDFFCCLKAFSRSFLALKIGKRNVDEFIDFF